MSVVIPVFNRASELARALRSVAAQRPVPPAEVLVVDDGSDDGSSQVALDLGARVLRQQTNGGPGQARDRGLSEASSPWCAFLDSDDLWGPSHLATLRRWAADDVGLVTASGIAISEGGPRVAGSPFRHPVSLRGPESLLQPENVVMTSACMVRTNVALSAGGFGHRRLAEDLDLWLRILSRSTGVLLPDITVRYWFEGLHTSHDKEMWTTAASVLRSQANLPPPARQALATAISWDRMRLAIRQRQAGEALHRGRELVTPGGVGRLSRLLWGRRERRCRWAERLTELGDLLTPTELTMAAAQRPTPVWSRRVTDG